jgi:DNA (cytosine-5)-methyltransferase 1
MPATDLAHPAEDRPLSVEEYACIQEFPSDWRIAGGIVERYKQIGNAVPIKLGEAIGKLLVQHINGESIHSFDGFRFSRYRGTDETSWETDTRKQVSAHTKQLSLEC